MTRRSCGAKRAASACQLKSSDLGMTIRDGRVGLTIKGREQEEKIKNYLEGKGGKISERNVLKENLEDYFLRRIQENNKEREEKGEQA